MARHISETDKSTQAQAEAGTDNSKWMTPLRTKQSIDALTPTTDFDEDDFELVGGVITTEKGYKQATGSTITFTRNRVYGTIDTPITGNITIDTTDAVLGVKAVVIHKDGTEPTYGTGAIADSDSGTYSTTDYNLIEYYYVKTDVIVYNVRSFSFSTGDSTLIFHYEFEEGSGGTAGDSGTHSNDGTIVNSAGADWVTGVVGTTALGLSEATPDPPNDPYIQIPTSATLQGISTAFTIAFWARRDVVDGSGVILNTQDGTTTDGILVNILSTGSRPEFYLNFATEGSTYRVRAGSSDGITSTFKHYCCTYDGSEMILYVDNVQSDSISSIPSIDVTSTADWFIAIEHDLTSPPDYIELDDVRVYDRALPSSEVTEIFNLGS